jgi:hypothetical protein
MYDICMKWCNNPFEINRNENILLLTKYRANNLQWLNENDLEDDNKSLLSKDRIYLIAKWKQKKFYTKKVNYKRNKQKLLLPNRFFLTDTYFILKYQD